MSYVDVSGNDAMIQSSQHKPESNMAIKSGRSEWMEQLPDGRVLVWGWGFRPAKDSFRRALRATPVTTYAYVSNMGERIDIVPTRIVGSARLATEAARIGRDALRQHVMGAVRDFAA